MDLSLPRAGSIFRTLTPRSILFPLVKGRDHHLYSVGLSLVVEHSGDRLPGRGNHPEFWNPSGGVGSMIQIEE